MDSITQAALGATVAGAIAGKNCNAKVLLSGALLGTLPDLDVMLDYGNSVSNTINHRGFTHSLFLIPFFSLMVAYLYTRLKPDPFWHFGRVLFLVLAVLSTHPLLDAMTTYGTQLLWPLPLYFEVRNVFIIDPLYTLPLLLAIVVALVAKQRGAIWCRNALVVSSLYLLWAFAAQQVIYTRVEQNLQVQNLPNTQVMIAPTPFNTVLWRVLVMGEDRYWEGLASLLDNDDHIEFIAEPRGTWPLSERPELLTGLSTFSHDFLRYREIDDQLIVTDLRLGMADQLSFQFVFANKNEAGQWQVVATPERFPLERSLSQLGDLWLRLKGDQSFDAYLRRNALVEHSTSHSL